jgi:hypothetical protein
MQNDCYLARDRDFRLFHADAFDQEHAPRFQYRPAFGSMKKV